MTRASWRCLVIAALSTAAAAGVVAACSPTSDSGAGTACPDLNTDCPSAPPSWSNDVQPILATYCLRCHGDGGVEQSQFDYTTYAGVYEHRSIMLTQVYQCQMPPSDASPPAVMPTTHDRQTLVSWLACNAPDN
jgi:cytochrome c553